MKTRYSLFIVIMLILMPVVSAKIYVATGFRETYNLNDKIPLVGYVLADTKLDGIFKIDIVCTHQQIELSRSKITAADKSKTLFSELGILEATIPDTVDGQCRLVFAVVGGSNQTDSAESPSFNISQELLGTFALQQNEVQLGEYFALDGTIYKLSGENIDGTVSVSIQKDGKSTIITQGKIKDGKVSIRKQLSYIDEGDYDIDVTATSADNNHYVLKNISHIKILSKIPFSVVTNNASYLPKHTVSYHGNVTPYHPTDLGNADVTLKFEGMESELSLKENTFKGSFDLSQDIEAGKHYLTFYLNDEYGNEGFLKKEIEILQDERLLVNQINKIELLPEEVLSIKPIVYDQTEKEVPTVVRVSLLDEDKTTIFAEDVALNQTMHVTIPTSFTPGTYTIMSATKKVKKNNEIEILPLERIELFELNGSGAIYISNTGNVRYKKALYFNVTYGEKSEIIKKRIPLDPNESIMLDLGDLLPEGAYSLVFEQEDTAFTYNNPEDKRSFLRKLGQGIASVMGTSDITKENTLPTVILFFVAVLILLALGFIAYYFGEDQKWKTKQEKKERQQFLESISIHKSHHKPEEKKENPVARKDEKK